MRGVCGQRSESIQSIDSGVSIDGAYRPAVRGRFPRRPSRLPLFATIAAPRCHSAGLRFRRLFGNGWSEMNSEMTRRGVLAAAAGLVCAAGVATPKDFRRHEPADKLA